MLAYDHGNEAKKRGLIWLHPTSTGNYIIREALGLTILAKSLGHFRKLNTANSRIPPPPLCNVDLKGPSHPESLQALSTLLGGGRGRAVTKRV